MPPPCLSVHSRPPLCASPWNKASGCSVQPQLPCVCVSDFHSLSAPVRSDPGAVWAKALSTVFSYDPLALINKTDAGMTTAVMYMGIFTVQRENSQMQCGSIKVTVPGHQR